MFALQSSIRTQYVPSRIFWGYFRDILKLYWRYIYCLPSNKYYHNKNVLMSSLQTLNESDMHTHQTYTIPNTMICIVIHG